MLDQEEFIRLMGVDNYAALAGMEVIRAEPGCAEVRMPVAEKLLNGHGNLHGGALFTLADYAGAIASNFFGEATMAVNGAISYLRPVRGGHVIARAKTTKTGRRMNFLQVEIYDAEERLVATFQGGAMRAVRKDANAS